MTNPTHDMQLAQRLLIAANASAPRAGVAPLFPAARPHIGSAGASRGFEVLLREAVELQFAADRALRLAVEFAVEAGVTCEGVLHALAGAPDAVAQKAGEILSALCGSTGVE
ncbi:MAG: hypothetical protein NVSMB48_00120 [Marmoricola sp.]